MRGAAHSRGAGAGLRRALGVALGLLIAVAAAVLAGFGTLSHTSTRDVRPAHGPRLLPARHAGQRVATRPTRSSFVTIRLESPAGHRGLQQLIGELNAQMGAAGPDSGTLVYDLDTGLGLYAVRDRIGRPPASVEKLYTTVALMRLLGPDARLHTEILGTGHQAGATWHGNLYLRGGGDPTFGDAAFNQVWYHGLGSNATELAQALLRRGIHRVTGRVYADESLFDRRRGGLLTDYAMDTPDYEGQMSALVYDHGSATNKLSPAQFAVKEVVLTMRGAGIQARWSKPTARTPKDARLLARVSSPPLQTMTRMMDVPSDDLFADLFAKQLGVLFGGGHGTLAAGARVISRTIAADYGIHPTILDGSGLSRDDRSSPIQIVALLAGVWHTPAGRQLSWSLPTVGEQGTVQGIGVKTPAQRRCIAKTGTLNDVTNLAGYCHSLGGDTLAFAFMIDGPPNWTATVLESKMVGDVASY